MKNLDLIFQGGPRDGQRLRVLQDTIPQRSIVEDVGSGVFAHYILPSPQGKKVVFAGYLTAWSGERKKRKTKKKNDTRNVKNPPLGQENTDQKSKINGQTCL